MQNNENNMNAKILKIKHFIGEKYPELLVFINEMPELTPEKKQAEITSKPLVSYFNLLQDLLSKHTTGLPYIVH